jgi:hypothetical protein
VRHDFGNAADVGRDNRPPESHRFEQRHRKPLVERRQDEDVQRRHDVVDVTARSDEEARAIDFEACRRGHQLVLQLAVAGEEKPRARPTLDDPCGGLQQTRMSLDQRESSDRSDQHFIGCHAKLATYVRRLTRRHEPVEIEPVLDAGHHRRAVSRFPERLGHALRDGDDEITKDLQRGAIECHVGAHLELLPAAKRFRQSVHGANDERYAGEPCGERSEHALLVLVHVHQIAGVIAQRPHEAEHHAERAGARFVQHHDGDIEAAQLVGETAFIQQQRRQLDAGLLRQVRHHRGDLRLSACPEIARDDVTDPQCVRPPAGTSERRVHAGQCLRWHYRRSTPNGATTRVFARGRQARRASRPARVRV